MSVLPESYVIVRLRSGAYRYVTAAEGEQLRQKFTDTTGLNVVVTFMDLTTAETTLRLGEIAYIEDSTATSRKLTDAINRELDPTLGDPPIWGEGDE